MIRSRSLLVVAVAALALSACGGDDPGTAAPTGGAAGGALAVTGQDDLRWDTESLAAPAGTIEFVLTCGEAVNHNLVIEETGEEVAACEAGGTATGTTELDAGTYTYVCTVPGHSGTMRGELTVG
jgi:azurin